MEYNNNKTLEIIIKNQKATNKNLITLNNNQRHQTNLIFKNIEINRSLIYDLQKEIKSLKKDLKKIKSVFKLNNQLSSPSKKNQEIIDLLSKPIDHLWLDNRPHNSLKSLANTKTGINNIYELVKLTEKELKRFRMMGKKSLNNVKYELSSHNLSLGMDISKYEPYLKLNTK